MIRDEIIEEAEIIRYSGEIPEVAYWNSIHYLTTDEEGPGLELNDQEKRLLKRAVVDRYLLIIKRDLTTANMDKSLYRGVRRAFTNWQRLKGFLQREGFGLEAPRLLVLEDLRNFLIEVSLLRRVIDVSLDALSSFIRELCFSPKVFLWGLTILCQEEGDEDGEDLLGLRYRLK